MSIKELMEALEISEEEARALAEADKEIDRMSMKEVDSDLSEAQKKASKEYRQADRKKTVEKPKEEKKKPTVYKFAESKKKKEKPEKADIISTMQTALSENGATDIVATNPEREFTFFMDGVKYKVVLSVPRK